jgi:hypothetical protein
MGHADGGRPDGQSSTVSSPQRNPLPWILLGLVTIKFQGGNDVQARSGNIAVIRAGICPR